MILLVRTKLIIHGILNSLEMEQKVYTVDTDTQRVYQFVLDTPWEVNNFTRYEGKYYELHSHGGNSTTANAGTNGLTFKPDGTKMFVLSHYPQYLNGFDLKTPWDILTSTPVDRFDLHSDLNSSQSVKFDNDGTKILYI